MNIIYKNKKNTKNQSQKGFSIFVAMIVTSVLLIVAFSVASVASKQISIATTNTESEYAYFAADSGMECALYWDTKVSPSAFYTGQGANFAQAYIAEYSGIDTDSPLDKISDQTQTNFVSGQFDSGSQNTSYTNELIFGHGEGQGPDIVSGPGFTSRIHFNGNTEEDKIVNSTGSYASIFNALNSYSGDTIALMATFKGALNQTINFVQINGTIGAPSTYRTIAFGNPSSNGDLVIATFTFDSVGYSIDSVVDNKGNMYARALNPLIWPSNSYTTEMWYAKNISNSGMDANGVSSPANEPIVVTANSPAFVPRDITCNETKISTGDSIVGTSTPARIGGGGLANPISIFGFSLNSATNPSNTCSVVTVEKKIDGSTDVFSHGYNTCDVTDPSRVERGIEVKY